MRRILNRRISMALGVVVLLAGLSMVAVGLYTYLDGDDSGPPKRAAAGQTERVTPPPPASTPTNTLTSTPSPPPLARDEPYRMIIEKLGVDAPVETYSLDPTGVPIVPNDANNADPAGVVAWYDFSAVPGTGSNAVFAGHVTWNGRAVFWSLDQIQPGDTITLRAQDGTELVYAVSDNFLVDAADPAALQVMQPTPTDTITLITCGGTWVPDPNDNVAGGDYTNRTVVRASLLSITSVASQQTSHAGG
ncbi:MAG: class F sortase [Chloroflexi bacterium]|nr:class F sortase [Chloroflexota bacterium]